MTEAIAAGGMNLQERSVGRILSGIQMALTLVGGWIGFFVGGSDGPLKALVAFVLIDYLTGVLCAFRRKTLSSNTGYYGILKKILIFALVGVSHQIDVQLVKSGSALRTAAICFYMSNEALSIMENASCLGLPVPQRLRGALKQLRSAENRLERRTEV